MRTKIKNLLRFKRKATKKIADMEDVLKTLKSQLSMTSSQIDILESISGVNRDLLHRMIKIRKNQNKNVNNQVYSSELKAFALTLHFYSPSAYNFVRATFDSCLPHPNHLRKWYSRIDGNPGFTEEAFKALRIVASNSERPLW